MSRTFMHFTRLALAGALTCTSTIAMAAPLELTTFNPTDKGVFPVTSTLISGDKDAILVNAQFEGPYANQLIDMVKESGKHLTTIFISYSDPDYYFGLDKLKKAFPDAHIVATPQTAYVIDASKQAKLATWKPTLGENAPASLLTPSPYTQDSLTLDGHTIQIKKSKQDPLHSFLWIPSLKTIIDGNSLAQGSHLWLADTDGITGINAWIKRLDTMASLHPDKVIPSHYLEKDESPDLIQQNRDYLVTFKKAFTSSSDAAQVVATMKKAYPQLADTQSLEMGAKVLKHEMEWQVFNPYPPIGYTAREDIGKHRYNLAFKDNHSVTISDGSHDHAANAETVHYTAEEVSPHVFKLSWHSSTTGNTVVEVENFNNGKVWRTVVAGNGRVSDHPGSIDIL